VKKTRKLQKLRPTSSLVKNALFNILGDIEGITFIDLFAGTGQIGMEAQKRGARVIFVEKNPSLASSIRKKAQGKVVCTDALKFLHKLKDSPDVIFADPPYNFSRYVELIYKAIETLSPGGIFILEHDKWHSFDADEERVYGDTVLSFWRKAP